MTLEAVFEAYRGVFTPLAGRAVVVADTPTRYYLATHEVRARDGYRTGFGGVEIGRRYVSVHLMPVYVHPELLEDMTDDLRRRMQGKSCFNFRSVEPGLLAELDALVTRGADRFTRDGRLSETA